MNTRISKSGKKTMAIAMAAIIITLILAIITPALCVRDVYPGSDEGIYFLDPRDNSATYGNTTTIDVWVNTSQLIPDLRSGGVLIETGEKSCAEMTGCWCNGTEWTQAALCSVTGGGKKVSLTYGGTAAEYRPPGNYHIGTITVGCNSSICCRTDLNITPEMPNSYVVNDTLPMPQSYGVGGENGTFCCKPYTKNFEPANAFPVLQNGQVNVEVVAPEGCVDAGDQFDVLINVTPDNAEVYGVQYEIEFTPGVIHAEWQNEGDFLNGAPIIIYENSIDNVNGKLSFVVTRVGAVGGVTEPGTLAVIHFTAVELGANTTLTFTRVKATDPDVNVIHAVVEDGAVEVCDDNIPPVASGKSMFKFNNAGYLSKTYFNGSDSYDPDGGEITHLWECGDGIDEYGKTTWHEYTSYNWNGNSYDPFEVVLIVQNDDTPVLGNSTTFPANVYMAGDVTGDGLVDIEDATIVFVEFMSNCSICTGEKWGSCDQKDKADLNNDCIVDIADATQVNINFWNTAW